MGGWLGKGFVGWLDEFFLFVRFFWWLGNWSMGWITVFWWLDGICVSDCLSVAILACAAVSVCSNHLC